MAPRRSISRGRGSARGAHWPRTDEMSAYLEMAMVAYSRAHVNCHNHFGHDGAHDPKVMHVFDGSVLLFLDGSSHERIEVIRTGSYNTLREIIIDAKISVPHEDVSVKPHFLFRDGVLGGNSFFYSVELSADLWSWTASSATEELATDLRREGSDEDLTVVRSDR
ncbi:uncharacterized protein A4U43_UnF4460 [Asparagus officinalis]|uniref:Uncharacterized protein n=1 Tax=Asparagus officinalis TaxID=4686 RepID=A0A1R3L6X6_ASPOF|nr:uncharacterized protein A4U43_UnF4460 [Asparagus officinalis]